MTYDARTEAHAAMRRADNRGACNLPACSFPGPGGEACGITCNEITEALQRAYDAGRGVSTPKPPVYCKHCPFSRHVHYEKDGKLVTPTCTGFEPMEIDQGGGH